MKIATRAFYQTFTSLKLTTAAAPPARSRSALRTARACGPKTLSRRCWARRAWMVSKWSIIHFPAWARSLFGLYVPPRPSSDEPNVPIFWGGFELHEVLATGELRTKQAPVMADRYHENARGEMGNNLERQIHWWTPKWTSDKNKHVLKWNTAEGLDWCASASLIVCSTKRYVMSVWVIFFLLLFGSDTVYGVSVTLDAATWLVAVVAREEFTQLMMQYDSHNLILLFFFFNYKLWPKKFPF